MKIMVVALALCAAVSAQAQVLSFLVKQWSHQGTQMCEYDNGTVLNMGAKICPLSIKVSL